MINKFNKLKIPQFSTPVRSAEEEYYQGVLELVPEEARDEQPIDVTITEYLTNTERFDVSEEMEEDDIIEEEAA